MTFSLSPSSVAKLHMVHPKLIAVVYKAASLTGQPFVVDEGMRTLAVEKQHVANGTSRTLNSMHLIQPDGFAHAVDLVPLHLGRPIWDWELIYPLAAAMREASVALSTPIRWGGCWDRTLGELPEGGAPAMKAAERAYCARHPGPDFVDGPHYELHMGPYLTPAKKD